jgi:chromosomal replication initiation ATPase DnaA
LGSDSVVYLLAPNRFIEDWVKNKFLGRIEELLVQLGGQNVNVEITVNRTSTPESVIQSYSSEATSTKC